MLNDPDMRSGLPVIAGNELIRMISHTFFILECGRQQPFDREKDAAVAPEIFQPSSGAA